MIPVLWPLHMLQGGPCCFCLELLQDVGKRFFSFLIDRAGPEGIRNITRFQLLYAYFADVLVHCRLMHGS